MGYFFGCFGSTTRSRSGPRAKPVDQVCLESGPTDAEETPLTKVKKYSWDEIENMTLNFKEVIGVGGYSNVYLAKLHDSNTFGAVKIYNSSERLNQVFKSELEICQKLHHSNIVNLLGYCDDKDEGVLVYEYIPNGNLQDKLHNENPTTTTTTTEPKNKTLSWKQRMVIAYQLAQALEYLHESGELHIVHGDIKASNILLDEQHNCKLCDFGLAKMGFSSMVKPPSSSRIAMMGSPGYMDPHFLMTGIASKKSDVYSYGVILLELITGFEAFVSLHERGDNLLLTSLVRTKGSYDVDKVLNMVDPRLVGNEGKIIDEQVKIMASIAGQCLHHLPSLRPSAKDLCCMIREKVFFPI